MSGQYINLTPQIYNYLIQSSVHEHEILKQLRERTSQMSMSQMQISPDQAQLMQLLVKLIYAQRTLEIGVFTGYSSLAVALALPKEGQVIACDINPEWTDIAKEYWEKAGVSDKIDLKLAPAEQTLKELVDAGEEETFDFIFIDADKKNYQLYYELSLSLVRPGGLIVIDNVLWSGQVVDSTNDDPDTIAIRDFNRFIAADDRVFISMIPVRDGLTLAMKQPTDEQTNLFTIS